MLTYFLPSWIRTGKLSSTLGFCFGSHWVGCVCHIVCGHPHYLLNQTLWAPGSGGVWTRVEKKFPGPSGRSATWPDSWLGSGATELGQELSPWAPALRPGRRGSVAVLCVGQDVYSVSRDFWQLLQLWSDSLVFPPTPSFKGGSSLTSHKLSTPFSSVPCRAWSTCRGK